VLRVLVLSRQPGAVAYYRQIIPARCLAASGADVTHFNGVPWWRALTPKKKVPGIQDWVAWVHEHAGEFDVILCDRPTDQNQLAYLRGGADANDAHLVMDFDDDFLHVPEGNPAWENYHPGTQEYETSLLALKAAEASSFSTSPLQEVLRDKTHFSEVLPNLIDPIDWEGYPVDPTRKDDPHLRILYSGAGGHYDDLAIIQKALTTLVEHPPTPFRFFGIGTAPRWLHILAEKHPGKVIILPWVPFEDFPKVLSWGGFDLSIAPLANNPFNASKSNIRFLESAVLNIPVIAPVDATPYKSIPSDCIIKVTNNTEGWLEGLTELLTNSDLRKTLISPSYRETISHWAPQTQGNMWYNFVTKVLDRPRIRSRIDFRLPSEPGPQDLTSHVSNLSPSS